MNVTQRTYIAIDPGAKGSVAWCNRLGTFVQKMPEDCAGVIILMKSIIDGADRPKAFMENVAAYIPGGGFSSGFEYGRNVERPQCVLQTLGIPITQMSPKAWQKILRLGSSNRISGPRMPSGLNKLQKKAWKEANFDELERVARHNEIAKQEWKNKLKRHAEDRYPELKVNLTNCDALLLLDAAIINEGEQLELV